MKTLYFTLSFALYSLLSFSQGVINTEKLIGESDNRFQLIFSPTLDFQKGNSDITEFTYSFTSLYKLTSRHWIKATGGSDIIKESGDDITNDNFFQIRHTFGLNNWSHTFAFFQSQNSFNLKIKQRQLIGGGVRFKLKKSEKFKFDIGAGVMNEKEEYNDANYEKQDKIRATTMIVAKMNLFNIDFKNITYYQPNLQTLSDYRVFSEFDMGFEINEWLGYEINYIVRYDNNPPDFLENNIDHYITSGFNIKIIR